MFDSGYESQAGAARQRAMAEATAAIKQAKMARSGRPARGRVLCKAGLHRWGWITTDEDELERRCRCCGRPARR